MEPVSVAVLGAGISGLSCAQALRAAGLRVCLFERDPRVGGRCSTRLWQGHLVDDGVPYFTAHTPEFKRELLTRVRQVRPIIPPILDGAGGIVVSAGGPRFFVLQGNNYFAQVLAQGLDVRVGTLVEKVDPRDGGFEILGEVFQAVVSSLPIAPTARLFGFTTVLADPVPAFSALLEYGGLDVGTSAHGFGHLLEDEAAPIAASYSENHKAARIVGRKTVFVVHSGFAFAREHAAEPAEEFVDLLIRANDDLWQIPAGKCTASFVYHSRHRLPFGPRPVWPPGAFICGDVSSGVTLEDSWHDGRRAAGRVLDFLAGKSAAT